MATNGSVMAEALRAASSSLACSPPHHRKPQPQKEMSKEGPHASLQCGETVSVTMGAALWGPGEKPRVSIWGLFVHLLAGIVEYCLLPARGGIHEADPEPRAPGLGAVCDPGQAASPWGVSASPTVTEEEGRSVLVGCCGGQGGQEAQLRRLPSRGFGL